MIGKLLSGGGGKLLGGHGGHGSSHGGHNGGFGGFLTPQHASYRKKPKHHGGMGAGGGAALGLGAGVIGGMLVADAIDDYGDAQYDQGMWHLLLYILMTVLNALLTRLRCR